MNAVEERAESLMAIRFDEKLNEKSSQSDQIIKELKIQLEKCRLDLVKSESNKDYKKEAQAEIKICKQQIHGLEAQVSELTTKVQTVTREKEQIEERVQSS